MTSTFSIKNILAVSSVFVMSLMSSTVGAVVYPVTTSQTSCTFAMRLANPPLCSIEVEGILRGLGNTISTPTAFAATILIQAGHLVFQNPAGKSSQANGVPFVNISVTLAGGDLIEASQINRNGRAISSIVFHDDDLIAAIVAALQDACANGSGDQQAQACASLAEIGSQIDQHPNWIGWAVVTRLEVLGQQWADSSTACDLNAAIISGDFSACTLEDALGNRCVAPPTVLANPQNFVGQAFDYVCTEACHNKTGTICPTSFPLP